MTTAGEEKQQIQLIIRCAMQSFSDYNIECPADWTVLQLKEHLSQVCSMKPEVGRQRLIYAGHCLQNEQKVRDVLMQRRDGMGRGGEQPVEKQVIHMVHIGKPVQTPAPSGTRTTTSEGLRHRGGQQMSANSSSSPSQQPQMFLPQQQQYYNFATFQPAATIPQQTQSYEAWMAAYQNYMGQMQHFYQQVPYASFMNQPAGQQATFGGYMGTAQMPQLLQQQQPPVVVGHHHPHHRVMFNNNGQLVVPQQQQPAMVAAEAGLQQAQAMMPDLLDIMYKSVRFALLAMLLYLYSSLERFIFVLAIVTLFWFVHRRRDQQQREQENAAAAQQAQAVQQEQEQEDDGQDEPEADDNEQNDDPNSNILAPNPMPQQNNNSPLNVFFTVVQSFFTSLVPNPAPAPLDIN